MVALTALAVGRVRVVHKGLVGIRRVCFLDSAGDLGLKDVCFGGGCGARVSKSIFRRPEPARDKRKDKREDARFQKRNSQKYTSAPKCLEPQKEFVAYLFLE